MKYKIILYNILLILFCTACTTKTYVEPKDTVDENNNVIQRKFTTKDKETNFTIHNEPKLKKEKLDKIMSEIDTAYEQIIPYSNGYVWEKNIDVFLKSQNFISYAKKDEVTLYNTRGADYQLAHELTHTLLGYGNIKKGEINAEYGYLTQEGFAVYLAEIIFPEKRVFPNNGLDVHKVMKYLLDQNESYSLQVLANNSTSQIYFNSKNENEMWKAYLQAGSFIKYLFETYKKEEVIKLYNSPDFVTDVETYLGKDINTIEEEWRSYLKNNVEQLTEKEKYKVLFP